MLSDTKRKVLRILFNRNGHNMVTINIAYYAHLADRQEEQIRKVLDSLADEQCVEWDSTFKRVQVINTFFLTGQPPENPISSTIVTQ